MLQSINPVSGKTIHEYSEHSAEETAAIIKECALAQEEWAKSDFYIRRKLMTRVSDILRSKAAEYAVMITREMGKPVAQSRAEVLKCANVCDYYVENAEVFLANEVVSTEASESYIAYRPLGVVLAVMPWNFPFWQVFRFAAPALMAGNGALLKHASNVTGSALMIEDIFKEAGFPAHLFRTLKLPGKKVAQVAENPLVKAMTLTGSVGAGRAVAAKAGEMLKKSVLELGGSDPYVVLEDAELESTVDTCVKSRLINSGQSCIAAKRFIVVKPLLKDFETRFVQKMKEQVMGDPMSDDTDLGPQASLSLRDELHEQVLKSIQKGATCLLGGTPPDLDGAWYPPTVLTGVEPGMPAYDEELFGPVAAIIAANDEDDAIRIANDSVFGLGAAVFTKDINKGKRIAEKALNAGCCFVNDFVKSDPRLPFGGIGDSGYGRELSYAGIREFTNIKTVYVK
jgi:succinate-semialdehyde dehydrogenase / glutarate-semialdehyde dehydrogenase